jgi:hypothetical protein
MSAFVTVVAAGQTSSLPFLLRDAFFPVCNPALLEGMHPSRGPEDLKHHTLIHDRSAILTQQKAC